MALIKTEPDCEEVSPSSIWVKNDDELDKVSELDGPMRSLEENIEITEGISKFLEFVSQTKQTKATNINKDDTNRECFNESLELEENIMDYGYDGIDADNLKVKQDTNLPPPGPNFPKDIIDFFKHLLPPEILLTLTPSSCGLCHEDFTNQRFAWKHYKGFNHKRTLQYFCKGTYKGHPSYYNMVLDTVFAFYPEPVTEEKILNHILITHKVEQDEKSVKQNIRQKGLDRLLDNRYIRYKDGVFTAQHNLVSRKQRSKQMTDRSRNVKHVSSDSKDQFEVRILEICQGDLPPGVVQTLKPDHCGLCNIELNTTPLRHYTAGGHARAVERFRRGSYLGHPPYPVMIEKYIEKVRPTNLKENEIVDWIRKNYMVGEEVENVMARVGKNLGLMRKKRNLFVMRYANKNGSPARQTRLDRKRSRIREDSPLSIGRLKRDISSTRLRHSSKKSRPSKRITEATSCHPLYSYKQSSVSREIDQSGQFTSCNKDPKDSRNYSSGRLDRPSSSHSPYKDRPRSSKTAFKDRPSSSSSDKSQEYLSTTTPVHLQAPTPHPSQPFPPPSHSSQPFPLPSHSSQEPLQTGSSLPYPLLMAHPQYPHVYFLNPALVGAIPPP